MNLGYGFGFFNRKRWEAQSSYLLDGTPPALVADFVRGRYALSGSAGTIADILTVSSGTKRVFGTSGALATVPANTPALGFVAGRRCLILEGPATNLLPYSDPRQWTQAGSPTVTDGPMGPDGVTPWCRLEDATTSQVSNLRSTVTIPADTATYTASILVLHDPTAVSNAHLRVTLSGGTTQEFRVAVNPQTGAIGDTQNSPVAAYRTNCGDFSLVELVVANNGTNTSAAIAYFVAGVADPASPTPGAVVTVTGWGYIAWGQFELGTRASSRILSSGSQGSRITDMVQLTAGAAAAVQGAAASLAWRGRLRTAVGDQRLVGAVGSGAIIRNGAASPPNVYLDVTSEVLIGTGVVPGDIGAAVGWDASGQAGAVNGGAAASGAGAPAIGFTSIYLGRSTGFSAGARQEVDELVVWPVRGTNAALQAQARGWA